jgi:hypothetical protein
VTADATIEEAIDMRPGLSGGAVTLSTDRGLERVDDLDRAVRPPQQQLG